MSKYIDADRLRAEIEKTYKSEIQPWLSSISAKSAIYDWVLPLIDVLQQEQAKVGLEEAARHVYESWMGGTMDDVRRDMAELGKVLNARKEE